MILFRFFSSRQDKSNGIDCRASGDQGDAMPRDRRQDRGMRGNTSSMMLIL